MDELHAFSKQTGFSKHKHVMSKQTIISLCSNSNFSSAMAKKLFLQTIIVSTRTHTFGKFSDIHIGLAIIRLKNLEFFDIFGGLKSILGA